MKLFLTVERVSSIESKSSHPIATVLDEYGKSQSVEQKSEMWKTLRIIQEKGFREK